MKIKIITGRPGSGKTSYALESLLSDDYRKVLYLSLEEISKFHKEKFPSLFFNKEIQFSDTLPSNDESFDLIVLDYIELSKINIEELKGRTKELWILSQLRKDGSHFKYPDAEIEIIKSTNFELSLKPNEGCLYFFETERKFQLLLKSRRPVFPYDADDIFSCWLKKNPTLQKELEGAIWNKKGKVFALLPDGGVMVLAQVEGDGDVMNGRRFTLEALGAIQFSYDPKLKFLWGWSLLDKIKREMIGYLF